MMKKIFLLPLLLLCPLFVQAAGKRDAATRQILDKAVERLTQQGGVSFSYVIIQQPNTANQQRTSGLMDVEGAKFRLDSREMLSWFDGKRQWSMIPGDTEVNLSEPDATEQQQMNPSLLLQLYKRGFTYRHKRDKLSNGERGYKIFLQADNKQQKIREMFIEVNEKYELTRISIREGKSNWVRILLSNLQTGKRFPANHFTFPAALYPDAEVIDLR